MNEEQVILVNENDEQIGLMPKMEAHEKAVLHRAFSVFIFNSNNELMLQQRAAHKYHVVAISVMEKVISKQGHADYKKKWALPLH